MSAKEALEGGSKPGDISRRIEAIDKRMLAIEAALRKSADMPDGPVPMSRPNSNRSVEVSVGVPIGSVILWPKLEPPPGFLVCDGSPIDAQQYPRLAQIYGTHLPDMRGRYPVGSQYPLETFGRSIEELQSMNFTHSHAIYTTLIGQGEDQPAEVVVGVGDASRNEDWPANGSPIWDLRQPSMTWTFIVRAG